MEITQEIMIGKSYRVIKEFPTLCCSFPRKVGEIIKVIKQHSPKRVLIEGEVGIHKIKMSKLNSCCEKILS